MGVERLELQVSAYGEGKPLPGAGIYEQLKGRARIALDPDHPADRLVTDLDLAPRDADGKVRFEADVVILRAADPARRNRRLLLDAVNRGNGILRTLGEGWVLSQGFTVVRCGWQHDVARGPGLGVDLVEAQIDGRPITGPMARMFEPDAPATTFVLGEPNVRPYSADPAQAAAATLTERDYLGGPPRLIPRDQWRFARLEGETPVEDFSHVHYPAGFQPGQAYELLFRARGAPLTGHGLAATRDVVAFLRFAAAAQGNPLAGEIDHVLAFGVSQSGRFLRQLLYDGFCEDREGRSLFDGLLIHTGGARLLETNWRFGQPVYNGWDAVSAAFPFTDAVQTDPATGITDGLLARSLKSGDAPKVVHTNTAAEYWGGQVGSLAHVSADGLRDAPIPETSRIYYLAGTQHGVSPLDGPPGRGAYPANTLDYGPLVRAAFRNLDRWVTEGIDPPPSRYGRLDDGSLAERGAVARALTMLPPPGPPARLAILHSLDLGPTARQTRRLEQVPPRPIGEPLTLHVSQVDADGNELAGVRHPEIAAPLATYTGWNPRGARIGGQDQNLRTAGAAIRLALTSDARIAAGDPRPSVTERFPTREAYLSAVQDAAQALVADRYMLAEDLDATLAAAGRRYDLYTQAQP